MAEHFPVFEKDTDVQLHKAQKFPVRFNPKKTTPRLIIIKMLKIKERDFLISLSANFYWCTEIQQISVFCILQIY